jgi:hypothetical protein
MSVQLRLADLAADRNALVELFRKWLTAGFSPERLDWLYSKGPWGPARTWVMYSEADDKIVGAGAAFPRHMYFDGEERTGCVFADFCVSTEYRSLGPSLRLQRALVQTAQESPFEFFYDFPSRSMLAIYRRLEIPESGQIVRWAKLLHAEEKLSRAIGNQWIAKGLATVIDPLLARRGRRSVSDQCEIEFHEGKCGEEFTQFDRKFQKRPGVQTVRSAEYLNWRYLESPDDKFKILAARRHGKLAGYAVCTSNSEEGTIVDLSSVEEPFIVASLLNAVSDYVSDCGAAVVTLSAVSSHPWSSEFTRAGFFARESSPFVASMSSAAGIGVQRFSECWYGMRGERDS